jgi:isopentenyldiphosphate isomerase
MQELWQLYSEQGESLEGKGAPKDVVFSKGLLHGAAHVWIWRDGIAGPEVLLQKRSATKRTWPSCYDISAAGHIDLGEEPLTAALREAKEEINLNIDQEDLHLISVVRANMPAGNDATENEFEWVYLLKLRDDAVLALQESEVASVAWVPLKEFETACLTETYVPHGDLYYRTLVQAIRA